MYSESHPKIEMHNNFPTQEQPFLGRRLIPLSESQLDNLPSTSKAAISVSVSSSISGCKSWHLVEDPLILEEPGFSGWAKPKKSASKRLPSPKVDPDYNPKAKFGSAPSGMMTRGQLKLLMEGPPAAKEPNAPKPQPKLLLEGPPAVKEPNTPKPKPKPQLDSLRRFRTGQRLVPTVWHSGKVCQHALGQICNPENRQPSESDVARWRAIESICLDLRGINVRGHVGVLKGPVSFEDVFQVLGLDEQGDPQVDPTPLPEAKVDSPDKAIEVVSSGESVDIEEYFIPTEDVTCPGRKPRARALPRPKSQTKSCKRGAKKTTKSTYRRR